MPVPLLLGLLFGLTVMLAFIGMLRPTQLDAVQRRMERYGVEPDREDEMAASLFERVIMPTVAWFVARVSKLLPTRFTANVGEQLEAAGWEISASRFVAGWLTMGLLIPAATLALVLMLGGGGAGLLAAFGAWIGLGLYLPWMALRRRITGRTKDVDHNLPDAIDMIVTAVESGLGLQAAMLKVAEHIEGAVGELFREASREVSFGRSRAEALAAMADRSGSREMRLFVRAVVQAERMGISIASVLRNQSREIRDRRQMAAREAANKIPVKITVPTVLFIFPTMFMLILGPVVLNVMSYFKGS